MKRKQITQLLVQEHFDYRDGGLYWKKLPRHAKKSLLGKRFGVVDAKGYRKGQFFGHCFEHQLVWVYHYGVKPTRLDHINHDTVDNRVENLRMCTVSQNGGNRASRKKFKGVYKSRYARYEARITHQQVIYYLGVHEDEIDAAKAYDKKAKELFGPFAFLNFPDD